MIHVLDLFSGIGGFSLGLESTGHFRTIGFCEIEPFCREVLRKHWPDVPIWEDVRDLSPPRADLVCGGVPCQPFSSASRGRKRGRENDRWLWREMVRIAEASGARWILLENVAHFESMALAAVASDLERLGWEVGTLEIPACAVGCDHRRSRLWVLGYTNRDGEPRGSFNAKVARLPWPGPEAGDRRGPHGVSPRLDVARRQALGNSVVPQVVAVIGQAIAEVDHGRAGDVLGRPLDSRT
ncbi:MAG: DNA (cytosine-5-)-methyltransferase [Gemmatimonadetes bacterium]|nr:DNA (cytosine-5-)-methyltransferase [Gemmatimonadota bacterium]